MAKRDYFDVLIVCPRESELQAALEVFQPDPKRSSRFEGAYSDLPYNIRLCRGWDGLPLSVAMVAQVECGGIETMKLVADLAKDFSVGLIAMTGTCSGEEDRNRGIEYGTVVVAKRTTTECGGLKKADGSVQSRARYIELDKKLFPSLNELVETRKNRKWLSYVPAKLCCASPRYVKDLLLECVLDKQPIAKKMLLKNVALKLSSLTKLNINETLEKMQKEQEPLVYAELRTGEYKSTKAGKLYPHDQVEFPCEDNTITVIAASIGSMLMETEKLDTEMKEVRLRMADHDIKAIDREAHFFMEQATNSFSPGLPVVMKGISNYGTEASKLRYYEPYAASTSAAFLRHFITEKESVISK